MIYPPARGEEQVRNATGARDLAVGLVVMAFTAAVFLHLAGFNPATVWQSIRPAAREAPNGQLDPQEGAVPEVDNGASSAPGFPTDDPFAAPIQEPAPTMVPEATAYPVDTRDADENLVSPPEIEDFGNLAATPELNPGMTANPAVLPTPESSPTPSATAVQAYP